MEIFSFFTGNIAIGLEAALTPVNLFYCFVGVFLGTLLGVIPGIGVLASISMLYPITFYLDPLAAVIMLAGIYYGTTYGGSTSSILLNLPGTPANAVACLDGHPMAKQGRAGVALLMTTLASFFGATIGIILMMAFSPIISASALKFGSAENFALVVLGLMASATISPGSPMKGVASALIGIIFGIVGTDVYTGIYRFTFGYVELIEGITLVAIAMGLFGVAEVISSIGKSTGKPIDPKTITFGSMLPTRDDVKRSWMPMLRGSGIGSFFGALPGTGGMMASFMTYAVEKKISKNPDEFGKGAIEGVTAPEAANNAADQTAFIPTMTLGIPGTPSMAIMLGILMLHGITPGPRLITDHPDVFWGLIMSFWIGNLMLLLLNIPLVGLWVRVLAIPYHYLYPAVLVFVCIGVLSVNNNPFDVWPVIAFAAIGYGMMLIEFPTAPLILGFVLGPLAEEHFRRAMLLSDGDFSTFIDRPISAVILAVVAILLVWAIVMTMRPIWSRPEGQPE